MVTYKYSKFIQQSDDPAFDEYLVPGGEASRSGIYRCINCNQEVAVSRGDILPPTDHAQHKLANGAVRWRLTVSFE